MSLFFIVAFLQMQSKHTSSLHDELLVGICFRAFSNFSLVQNECIAAKKESFLPCH